MILKGSQRGSAKQLGLHLLKTEENEHVELHEIRGFVAEDVIGALREAEATAKGTKCSQYLFSVSLNPPETENVRVETFETALSAIEEKNGLTGQPRIVIFHEKEGRRHCHAVWSRIDAETMTAKPMSFYKNKLREVSRQLYLENGWQMPRGLIDPKDRDPRNFSLDEWQQARRMGRHAGDLKEMIQEAWATSDSGRTFAHALEERGLYLAKGDRRGHVAVTFEGEVISIARATGIKAKDLKSRVGDPADLRSVEDTRKRIGEDILPRIKSHMDEARTSAAADKELLEERRLAMARSHAHERMKLDLGQKARAEQEARNRAERFRKGFGGLWDRLSGQRAKLEKQNEIEALWALRRDQEQRQAMIAVQLQERHALQFEIRAMRSRHAQALRDLHFDAANYRLMKRGQEPRAMPSFEHAKPRTPPVQPQPAPRKPDVQKDINAERLDDLRARSSTPSRPQDRTEERLRRLRQNKRTSEDRGPEPER
ncbi:relaxase [Alloyangia pacifica]|uniref:Relaxase n=1 Tax=Alloyangia pacifica TaxID=311180 RepID=A0A2U8HHX4_9RHOB|nr:relaxase/mobilization nuclease domain-containing protein [Alloyangia pacifica]AWI85537.1 relaxase [Alloyangia pacifica]